MMAHPNSIVAKREGFVSLGSASEISAPMQNSSVFVRRKWAQEHTELLVRFIMASIEAQRWIMLPANKLPVINLIQKNKTPFDVASQTYELEVNSPGGWNKDARFSVDNFKNVLKLRQDIEGTWGAKLPPPDRYYDPIYYERALAKIKASAQSQYERFSERGRCFAYLDGQRSICRSLKEPDAQAKQIYQY